MLPYENTFASSIKNRFQETKPVLLLDMIFPQCKIIIGCLLNGKEAPSRRDCTSATCMVGGMLNYPYATPLEGRQSLFALLGSCKPLLQKPLGFN